MLTSHPQATSSPLLFLFSNPPAFSKARHAHHIWWPCQSVAWFPSTQLIRVSLQKSPWTRFICFPAYWRSTASERAVGGMNVTALPALLAPWHSPPSTDGVTVHNFANSVVTVGKEIHAPQCSAPCRALILTMEMKMRKELLCCNTSGSEQTWFQPLVSPLIAHVNLQGSRKARAFPSSSALTWVL